MRDLRILEAERVASEKKHSAYLLMLAALKTSERFIKAERDLLERSYLPGASDYELQQIHDVIKAQEIIQRAIVAGELSQ